MNLNQLGEFGLIGRIAEKVIPKTEVPLGIGDDAACTVPTPGMLTVVTSDMLVEGVHFDLGFTDPVALGRKSLAVNLSDIAAMGAIPRTFLLSVAIPPSMSVEFMDNFCAGLLCVADTFGVTLVGGDTCASRNGLVISITLMGEQLPGLVIRRSGARPGDVICVTGTLGDSSLGFELLRKGFKEGPSVLRHINPVPRVREGLLIAGARSATAMIDVSDGLLADLGHILKQSKVGARVTVDSIPLSDDVLAQSSTIGLDPVELALSGGEDYELLFTVPPLALDALSCLSDEKGAGFSVIGEITETGVLAAIAADGSEYPIRKRGYNHFA